MDAQHTASEFAGDFPTIGAREADEASPFVTMWLHPRRTMRRISSTYWETWAIPIAMLGGAGSALQGINPRQAAFAESIGVEGYGLIAVAAALSMLGSVLYVIVFGRLVSITGDWLGGESDHEAVKAAIGWSYLPLALMLPIGVLVVVILGPSAVFLEAGPAEAGGSMLLALAGIAFLVTWIWSTVLTVASVREVQGFSVKRAIGNLVLAMALPWIAIAIVFIAGGLIVYLVDVAG